MRKKCKLIAGMLVATMLNTALAGWSTPIYASSQNITDTIEISGINTKKFDYFSLNEEMQEEADIYYTESYEGNEYNRVSVEEVEFEEFIDNFPKSVDNSANEYFPEVGDQSFVGNCGYWSNYYTNFTVIYNRKNGIKTTLENSHNPMFGYVFYGRSKEDSAVIATEIGYPTIGVLPVDYYGTDTFSPTAEVWEDAIMHRMDKWVNYKSYGNEDEVIEGPDDPSLKVMKQALYNGDILGIGSLSGKWNYSVVASENFAGELAIDRCDAGGIGGHGLSIIGYNDEVWIDINYDGKVQKAEMGAFKLVNSWGPEWGNKGFVWLAYDAINAKSQILTSSEETRINNAIAAGTLKANKVNNASRSGFFMGKEFSTVAVRERNTSNCWCYISVNTGSRKQMTMSVTATKKSDGTKKTYNFPSMIYESDNLAWDASKNSTDATMVFDLDNLIEDISVDKMEDYTWETTFGDTILDKYSVTVKDVYFTLNGVKKYVTSVSKVPLNGKSKTYKMDLRTTDRKEDSAITQENKSNVVIYYDNSGYSDSLIHYRVGTGTWTTAPGVQMCRTDEQNGYKWKYVINLGSASNMTACFNNGNNTWDNNGSKDYVINEAGCYGIKDGKITKLTEIIEDIEPIIELDKTNLTLKVSEEEIITPTVIDGLANDITWTSSNEKVATVTGGKVTALLEGSTTITAKIGDVKVTCEVKVEKKEEPLAGTLTVAGSKENVTKTVGSKIVLDAKGIGGSGSYTYKFAVLNVDNGKWSILQDFKANASYTFALNYSGTKQFAVTVKDSIGKTVATNRITVKVTNPVSELKGTLKVNNSTEALTKNKGSKITLNASGIGGSGSYTYKFAVLNVDNGKWSILKEFSSVSSYTYSLDYLGTKQFAVTVKDSEGKTVATNRITVKVIAESSTGFSAKLSVNGITGNVVAFVGDSVKLNVTVVGGSGNYTYKYVVYNVNTNTWFTLKDFNNSDTYTTKFSSAGIKQFVVTVKDSGGKTVSTERVTVNVLQ